MNEQKFFCIRGYMKSGTNWVSRLLNSHPKIQCVGEFHWETFHAALETNVNRIAPKRRETLDDVVRPELHEMVRRCLVKLTPETSEWIGDRTPTTIAPIAIPHAPHIVIVRDFRDVIVSRMFHLYSRPRVTTVFENYPKMKERLAKFEADPWYFRQHPEELLDNEEIVRTSAKEWKQFLIDDRYTIASNPDLPVLSIRYELLHTQFLDEVTKLFEFLNLDAPEIPNSLNPGHQDEDPTALNRKGAVGDWRNYFHDKTKNWVNDELLEVLLELGYITSIEW